MEKKKKKSILSCINGYKFSTIMSPITVALEVVMEILIPLVMSDIINIIDFNNKHEAGATLKLTLLKFLSDVPSQKAAIIAGFILIGFAILSLGFGVLSGIFSAKASCGFAKNLRKEIYYSIQDFSFANIDKFSTSSLITRTTTDVTNVQMSFQMVIRIAVRAPFMLIFAFIMSIVISPKISMIFVVVVPVLALALFFIMTKAHPNFKKMFAKYDDLNTVVQENVAGARTVKAFVREDFETKKFKHSSEEIYKYSVKAEGWLAFNNPFMQAAVYVCFMFVSFMGAKLCAPYTSTFTTGDLNALFTYIMQILMSLMMLSMIIVMITMSKASVERISAVINEEPTIKNCENPVYTVNDGSIVFDHVDFSYEDSENKLVLSDINLNIKSGMTVGIVGGTGSAKSTLVNLIPRLYDITSGSLKVGGVEVKDYDIKTLRDEVSVVLQKNVLFTGTIASNLRWGNEFATEEEIEHASKLAQADEFVSRFPDKYNSHIEQGGANVSGGQRQRLCIARALMKHPKILILDDSTSAVDTKTDALIRKAFREEIPDTTKIIIAQRISSVEDADMIIVLDDGHISGVGTHKELLKSNEIYKEVYTSQVKGAGSHEE
ncbi:MAG TPA: ABC transporter ATP-binding protein [Acholeplasmatales bacterium]|nr:aBC transporter permease/ATP-binding protein [Clostridium sp. CAG:307]HCS25338.1 ABC transporter ATP-binding protein [Acholeplasmatales bacterium]